MPSVRLFDGYLRLIFDESQQNTADFHYIWLRHQCDADRHPATGERIICSSEFGASVAPLTAEITQDPQTLLIIWNGAGSLGNHPHVSRYSLEWLWKHAYARNRVEIPPPPSELTRIQVQAAGLSTQELAERTVITVAREGVALVRGFGTETESLISAYERVGLRVRETHFGRIEDLRTDNQTNKNTDQLGYTNEAVGPHTDQPFISSPPRFQLLQSLRAATYGGENAVVDARQAARYLQARSPNAHRLLTEVPVLFDRRQRNFQSSHVSPILSQNQAGDFQIRYSYFTLAPFQLPFELMDEWYAAYHQLARLVRDPRYQYRFLLSPGDYVIYDNHRMLHARNRFVGPRWVRGVYFDKNLNE